MFFTRVRALVGHIKASISLACLCLLCIGAGTAQVVQSNVSLPDSSVAGAPTRANNTAAEADALEKAAIRGAVVDPSGASIAHARVQLATTEGRVVLETSSGEAGVYAFNDVPAATYQVRITAPGFAPYTSAPFTVSPVQTYQAAVATLAVATADTAVYVSGDDSKVAEAEIKAAERQRVLGIVPNFYTSYVYDAVPLTSKQKYRFALRETFDPVRFLGTGIGAAIEQANGTYAGYGDGAAGYGKRYAALYGDGLFSDVLSHAVFPSIFHQDPRYFYQGTGTVKSRFAHAVSFAVLIRGDNGRTAPNYSYLLGDLVAGSINNLYFPHADRGPGLVFTSTAIGMGGRAAGSLAREFILPRLTTHKAGTGKR